MGPTKKMTGKRRESENGHNLITFPKKNKTLYHTNISGNPCLLLDEDPLFICFSKINYISQL